MLDLAKFMLKLEPTPRLFHPPSKPPLVSHADGQTLRSAIAGVDRHRGELVAHRLRFAEPCFGRASDQERRRRILLARLSATASFHGLPHGEIGGEEDIVGDTDPSDPGFQELAALHLVRSLVLVFPRLSLEASGGAAGLGSVRDVSLESLRSSPGRIVHV